MVFCMYCGAEIADDAAYCHKCGKKLQYPTIKNETTDELENNEVTSIEDEALGEYELYYDASPSPKEVAANDDENGEIEVDSIPTRIEEQEQPIPAEEVDEPTYNNDYSAAVSRVEPILGLRWHTFLTKILWLGIVFSALGGIRTLYEAFFNEEYFELFNTYPTLRVIEILYGLLTIAYAMYLFRTRAALANFERQGPSMLFCCIVFIMLLPILYYLAYSITTKLSFFEFVEDSTLGGRLIATSAVLIFNILYYRKRQHLFGRLN